MTPDDMRRINEFIDAGQFSPSALRALLDGLTVKTIDAETRLLLSRAARMRELLGMRHDFPMRRDLWLEAKKVIVRPPASTAASDAEKRLWPRARSATSPSSCKDGEHPVAQPSGDDTRMHDFRKTNPVAARPLRRGS